MLVFLAGCASASGSNLKDKPDDAREKSEEAEDDSRDEAKPEKKKKKKSDKTSRKSKGDFDFAAAFQEGRVDNNGHYFVRIGDKVYFRNISPNSHTRVRLLSLTVMR